MSVTHSRIQRTVTVGVEAPDRASAHQIAAFLRAVGTRPDTRENIRAVASALLQAYPLAHEVEIVLRGGGEPGLRLRREGGEAPVDPSLAELVDDSSCSLTCVMEKDGDEVPVECRMLAPIRDAGRRLGTVALRTGTAGGGLTERDLDLLAQLSGVCGMSLRMSRMQAMMRDGSLSGGVVAPQEMAAYLGRPRLPLVDGIKFLVEQRGGSGRTVDFYDAFWVGPQRLAILVGNATGTTILPAALVAPWFAARLRLAATAHPDERADQSLAAAQRDLTRAGLDHDLVDCTLIVLDVGSLQAEVATSGEDVPLVWRRASNSMRRVFHPFEPVAGTSDGRRKLRRIRFTAGDSMLLYTRGVVRAPDAQGRAYGFERLEQSLGGGLSRFSEMVARAMSTLRSHIGSQPPEDLTVLGVVIGGMGGHRTASRPWPDVAPRQRAAQRMGSGTST